MRLAIRFAIGKRLGAASVYTLIEFCVHIIDRYGLKEGEVATVVTLQVGESHEIPGVMIIKRLS